MLRSKGVEALELVSSVHLVQALDACIELLFVEHGEDRQDVLLHQQVQGWLPELKDALSMQTRVDTHGNIRNLDLLGSDPPGKRNQTFQKYHCIGYGEETLLGNSSFNSL